MIDLKEMAKEFHADFARDHQVGGDHYLKLSIQPWDAMECWLTEEEFKGFLKGNIIKYIARCDHKGGRIDIEKIRQYVDKLLELY